MKYEAKCASTSALSTGLTTATNVYNNGTTACTAANSRAVVSVSSGNPLVNVDQNTASSYATNTNGCTGCKLITEAEWLTIAQNVLSNPINWSGNAVGSGYIYSGHNDNSSGNSLPASDDSNGYSGTGNTAGQTATTYGMQGNSQKRTLTLTNGETIWDMAGNVWEWTAGTKTGGQPTGTPGAWREWTAVSGGTISPSPYPSTTGLSGASAWNSSNGIGMIYSDSADATLRGFRRGGMWDLASYAGVLSLDLSLPIAASNTGLGFRVSR